MRPCFSSCKSLDRPGIAIRDAANDLQFHGHPSTSRQKPWSEMVQCPPLTSCQRNVKFSWGNLVNYSHQPFPPENPPTIPGSLITLRVGSIIFYVQPQPGHLMIWALARGGSLQVALVDAETTTHCRQQFANRHLTTGTNLIRARTNSHHSTPPIMSRATPPSHIPFTHHQQHPKPPMTPWMTPSPRNKPRNSAITHP